MANKENTSDEGLRVSYDVKHIMNKNIDLYVQLRKY